MIREYFFKIDFRIPSLIIYRFSWIWELVFKKRHDDLHFKYWTVKNSSIHGLCWVFTKRICSSNYWLDKMTTKLQNYNTKLQNYKTTKLPLWDTTVITHVRPCGDGRQTIYFLFILAHTRLRNYQYYYLTITVVNCDS